jgi:hypothetical protein
VAKTKLNGYEQPEYTHFYVVDPDFVARIQTTAGDEMLEFSLDDPAIKKILTDCGLTYGQFPATSKQS